MHPQRTNIALISLLSVILPHSDFSAKGYRQFDETFDEAFDEAFDETLAT